MSNFRNKFIENAVIFFEILWQVLSGISNWIAKGIIRFLNDVLKHIYGKAVVFTAVVLLGYFISKLK